MHTAHLRLIFWVSYEINQGHDIVQINVILMFWFFSAATKTKASKATQKKKATKGGKAYESSPRWKNINIEFGEDLVGEDE